MDCEVNGVVEKIHCPTTGRIGDIDLKDIDCLLSFSDNPNRKTRYTLEAISVSDADVVDKRWVGVNQIASNKYVEYFLKSNQLEGVVGSVSDVKREVVLGDSKLDFLVNDIYLEVKTPLQTLQIDYDSSIKTKKVKPFSSTDRFVKHMNDLGCSLRNNERAVLLTVFQYDNQGFKVLNHSTNYEEVKSMVNTCIGLGVEIWQVNMEISNRGVSLSKYWDITESLFDFTKNI